MTAPTNAARDPYAPSPDEQARQQRIHKAWNAYYGVFQGGNKQWPLLWKEGKEPNPNIIVNRCGPSAAIDVAWLMGEQLGIALPTAPQEAQDYANQVWGVSTDDSSDDDKMTLLQELATNGAVTGHAFIKINWDSESDQEYPELVVLDSSCVRVKTDPHNIKVVTCYIIEYAMPDPDSRDGAMGTFRQVIELVDPDGNVQNEQPDTDATWQVTDYFKSAKSQQFVKGDTKPWKYSWAPIDGCPHIAAPNQYYGRPRITEDAIHINEAICTTVSNINKIGMRHGHPILYTIKQGANQKSIRHEPGTILEVSSDVKAVEAHGDIAGLRAFRSDLDSDFEEETHIPALAYGRTDSSKRSGNPSGVAIKLDFSALVADITKERRTYGALIKRVTQHTLELKNPAWADTTVTLNWPDVIPTDLAQAAQIITAALQGGVMSKQTAAEKFLKLNWETEEANMQEEEADAAQAFARGQGMPPATDPMPMPAMAAAGDDDATNAPANMPQQNMPPVNHPSAVAARQTMQSMMGGGQ